MSAWRSYSKSGRWQKCIWTVEDYFKKKNHAKLKDWINIIIFIAFLSLHHHKNLIISSFFFDQKIQQKITVIQLTLSSRDKYMFITLNAMNFLKKSLESSGSIKEFIFCK